MELDVVSQDSDEAAMQLKATKQGKDKYDMLKGRKKGGKGSKGKKGGK